MMFDMPFGRWPLPQGKVLGWSLSRKSGAYESSGLEPIGRMEAITFWPFIVTRGRRGGGGGESGVFPGFSGCEARSGPGGGGGGVGVGGGGGALLNPGIEVFKKSVARNPQVG